MAFQVTPDTNPAEAAMFHGAKVGLSANQSVSNNALTVVEYDTVLYDTDGFFSSGDYGFVIPEGVKGVRLFANVYWAPSTAGRRIVAVSAGGATVAAVDQDATSSGVLRMWIATGMIPVSTGDVCTIEVLQSTGGALDVRSDERFCFFGMEVVKTPFGHPASPTLP